MEELEEKLYQYTRIIGGEVVNFVTTNIDLAFARTHDKVRVDG